MLVLSRREGERLVMSNGVAITVLGWHGSQVKLGIEAPADVRILMEEVVHAALHGSGDAGRADDRGTRPAD